MSYTAAFLIERRKEKWEEDHDLKRDRRLRNAIANELLCSQSLLEEVIRNPEYLIELTFVVVNKDKEVVPFFFNEVQQDFIGKLNDAIQDYKNGNITEISLQILKGRQQGFTSLITAYQLANILLRKNFEGFTVADESDNAEAIFENKAKYPYSQLPDPLKPTEKYNNRRQIQFEKLNSTWAVEVATKKIGRSRTINFLHTSEGAFFQYGFTSIQASLGEALTKDCIKIHESTANGWNDFHDMWDSKVSINCFYEWWRSPEYTLKFESNTAEQEFEEAHKGEEWIAERLKWLKEKGISTEQRYWYYCKWKGYLDKELIKQEYPCTDTEAFLMSGRPVFNNDIINQRVADLKEKYKECPYKQGHFNFTWHDAEAKDKIMSHEFIEGTEDIKIYEDVRRGYPYVIGADTKGEGKDFYTATVINNASGNRVATLRMQLNESTPFTHQLYCLGKYFNNALIGVEMNFNTAPIEELQRLRYPRQYTRQQYDDITKSYQKKYGWKTDGNTRPLIIDKEVGLIKDNIELFNDITMLEECMTFVYDKNGRPDAVEGKHDDQLFSDMIANEIRPQQRFTVIEEPEVQKPKLIDKLQKNKPVKTLTGR